MSKHSNNFTVTGHICATPTAGPRPPPFVPPIVPVPGDEDDDDMADEVEELTTQAWTTSSDEGFTQTPVEWETTVGEELVEEQEEAIEETERAWEQLSSHVTVLLETVKVCFLKN